MPFCRLFSNRRFCFQQMHYIFRYFDSYKDRIDKSELYFCSGCGLNPDSEECAEWKKVRLQEQGFTTQDGEVITEYATISLVVIGKTF